MILVHSGIFIQANFDHMWRHDLGILFTSNAPKYILNRIADTELIKQELRTAIMIMIFFYYRPPLLLLAGCMQLSYGMVLGISKDDNLWQLGFLQEEVDCIFLQFRFMANFSLFFCQEAYRQLEGLGLPLPFLSPLSYWFQNKWIQHCCLLLNLLSQKPA